MRLPASRMTNRSPKLWSNINSGGTRESLQPRITAKGRWLSRKRTNTASESLPCKGRLRTNRRLPSIKQASASCGVWGRDGMAILTSARHDFQPSFHRRIPEALLVVPREFVRVARIHGQQFVGEDREIVRQVFRDNPHRLRRVRLVRFVPDKAKVPVLFPLGHQD